MAAMRFNLAAAVLVPYTISSGGRAKQIFRAMIPGLFSVVGYVGQMVALTKLPATETALYCSLVSVVTPLMGKTIGIRIPLGNCPTVQQNENSHKNTQILEIYIPSCHSIYRYYAHNTS